MIQSITLLLFFASVFLPTSVYSQISWHTNSDLIGDPISSIVQTSAGTLFASSDQNGVYRSTNKGASWLQVNSGLTQSFVHSLLVKGTRLFAAANGGVFVSTNSGASWTRIASSITGDHRKLILADDGSIVLATGGLWRSPDNGASWTKSTSVSSSEFFQYAAKAPSGALYAVNTSKLYISNNNGVTWTLLKETKTFGESYWSVAVSPAGEIYLGTNRALLRSATGTSWETLETNMTPLKHTVTFFNTNGDIFAGTSENGSSSGPGLAISTDHGGSWVEDPYFADESVLSIMLAADGHMFIGTGFYGVINSTGVVRSGVEPEASEIQAINRESGTGAVVRSDRDFRRLMGPQLSKRMSIYSNDGRCQVSAPSLQQIQLNRLSPGLYSYILSGSGLISRGNFLYLP